MINKVKFNRNKLKELLDVSKVGDVYISRKPYACRCGCAGDWFHNPKDVDKVKRVINKLVNNAEHGIEVNDNYIYTLVLGSTEYSVYLDERYKS